MRFEKPHSLSYHDTTRTSLPSITAVSRLSTVDEAGVRSEEHTSELQSLMRISYAVFCLKKKKKTRVIVHRYALQVLTGIARMNTPSYIACVEEEIERAQ